MDKNGEEVTKNYSSRVVKIESEESWDFLITQATIQQCPVVVHFTACWCMPSVAMAPFFEELALCFQDLLFLTLDVDEVKGVAEKMKVKAMPTFMWMNKEGEEVDRVVGANPFQINKLTNSFVLSFRPSNT